MGKVRNVLHRWLRIELFIVFGRPLRTFPICLFLLPETGYQLMQLFDWLSLLLRFLLLGLSDPAFDCPVVSLSCLF